MADLNALIAQGAQFQAPIDPFAQYGKMQQLQQGQQANQLNQMKMQEMQAANMERNALRQLDPTSPDYESQLFKVNPTMGIAYRKEAATAAAQKATQEAQQAEALKTNLANHRSFLVGVNDQPSYDAWRTLTAKNIPQLASILPAQFSAEVKDSLLKTADDVSKRLTAAPEKAPTSADATTMQALGYPLTPEGFTAFKDAQRQERMLNPAEEAQKIRIANASRPPAAPRPEPAPSITNIVDPTNPNQMIAIDTRRYQGGGVGSQGVIGVGGKEPSAAVRTNKVEAGKTQLADDLDNLRSSFDALDKMRAIPSTARGGLSNVTSALAASRAGQLTGQAFATEAQVERDVINSARTRLVNSIKNATGMSAQQLNSNVELQTMLKSISDPGQSYQSALRIIDDIENAYVKGDGTLPKRNRPTVPAAAKSSGGGTPPPPPGFKPD
jgi:hypothetical protein